MDRRSFALRQPAWAAASALGTWWGLLTPTMAQVGFKLQTPTALPPTPQSWTFLALVNGDLAAVQRQGSNGKTEIHILSANDRYQRFVLQVETPLPAAGDQWDFVALPNRDIAGVFRAGSTGRTEIHVLDAGKRYSEFKMQTPTALPVRTARIVVITIVVG